MAIQALSRIGLQHRVRPFVDCETESIFDQTVIQPVIDYCDYFTTAFLRIFSDFKNEREVQFTTYT